MYWKPRTPQQPSEPTTYSSFPLHLKDEIDLVSSYVWLLSSFKTEIIMEFAELCKDFYEVFSKNHWEENTYKSLLILLITDLMDVSQ